MVILRASPIDPSGNLSNPLPLKANIMLFYISIIQNNYSLHHPQTLPGRSGCPAQDEAGNLSGEG
jgi:hypothetical protein